MRPHYVKTQVKVRHYAMRMHLATDGLRHPIWGSYRDARHLMPGEAAATLSSQIENC